MAHGCDIPVEAELGSVSDAEVSDGIRLTTVEEAKGFVVRTGVDFLAVSIGTAHGRIKGRPRLDNTRLRQIHKALSIPLVIHGGTGLDEAQIQRLVANGAAKINFFTALDEATGAAITNQKGRFTDRTRQVSEIITSEADKYIRWCGAAGRATEVIAQCRSSEPVEHLIIYNLSRGFEHQAEVLMGKGPEVLSTIPGVRMVITGTAVQENAAYRLCWLVRFVSPAVIAGYRAPPQSCRLR